MPESPYCAYGCESPNKGNTNPSLDADFLLLSGCSFVKWLFSSQVSSDNAPLSITLRPILVAECQAAQGLTLEGDNPVLLTADHNPVTFDPALAKVKICPDF